MNPSDNQTRGKGMSDVDRRTLKECYPSFVKDLDINHSPFLDLCKARSVLQPYMVEDIESCTNSEKKISRFIHFLSYCGSKAMDDLIQILYDMEVDWLADEVQERRKAIKEDFINKYVQTKEKKIKELSDGIIHAYLPSLSGGLEKKQVIRKSIIATYKKLLAEELAALDKPPLDIEKEILAIHEKISPYLTSSQRVVNPDNPAFTDLGTEVDVLLRDICTLKKTKKILPEKRKTEPVGPENKEKEMFKLKSKAEYLELENQKLKQEVLKLKNSVNVSKTSETVSSPKHNENLKPKCVVIRPVEFGTPRYNRSPNKFLKQKKYTPR